MKKFRIKEQPFLSSKLFLVQGHRFLFGWKTLKYFLNRIDAEKYINKCLKDEY